MKAISLIHNKIHEVRGQKIMLDFDLAELYNVETKNLNKAVKRNLSRFPIDFMFQLTKSEWENLRFQKITSSKIDSLRFQIGTLKNQRGQHSKYLPYAFTEQGVSMLSAILNSQKAIDVSIAIIRAFVMLRHYALNFTELKKQIKKMEKEMNRKFKDVYEALNFLLNKDKHETLQKERKRIGYK